MATAALSVPMATAALVHEFWRLMATNDFHSVAQVLADDFVLEWPQSKERIRGAQRFAQMNAEYPAQGPWRFSVRRVVAQDDEAVSEVDVTDGVTQARALSFFTIGGGRIRRIVEYWPDAFAAPEHRGHLVERCKPE